MQSLLSVNIFVLCLTLFGSSLAQTASSNNSADHGCSINNGSVFVPVNTTVADDTWWYLCIGNSWLAQGCVVNGQRYDVGETFFGYLGEFYGRCEALDGKYIRATVLGCLDVNNNTVDPGRTYVADPLFWANCTTTKQQVSTPELGNITLDIIGRKIVGCNDGSNDIIPDEGTFVQVSNDGPLLAGVGLVCKIQGAFPQVQPQVCVVANNSASDENYVGLADHCYGKLQKFVFYCTIAGEENLSNGTAVYGWEIGWNISTTEFIASLKSDGFRDCINEPSKQPQRENVTVSTLPLRQKREIENVDIEEMEDEGVIVNSRVKRASNIFLETDAYSKFTLMRKDKIMNKS